MSHVTHTHESCHTCAIVMSHICMSHVTRMNQSCRTFQWVMSACMDESCHTYTCVLSRMRMMWSEWLFMIRMIKRSWPESWVMSQIWMMWSMKDSYVWHDVLLCVTWLIHMCDITHHMNDVIWTISHGQNHGSCHRYECCDLIWMMWSKNDSYVWHDSFICVTWLIHMCDMTHSYVWHDSSYEWCDLNNQSWSEWSEDHMLWSE